MYEAPLLFIVEESDGAEVASGEPTFAWGVEADATVDVGAWSAVSTLTGTNYADAVGSVVCGAVALNRLGHRVEDAVSYMAVSTSDSTC